ncbi:MAG: aldehyde dehydrogenase family protein, partial [Robiginitomaculum sp.]|nr:aldehyde dehydrogenase family protein [Robiginitomaculum sp.]
FKTGFTAKMNAMKVGNPLDADTDMGPISSKRALGDVAAQLASAKAQGAAITHGTQTLPVHGFYMRPAIIEGVTKDMDIYGQEIFAPAAMLFKVSNLSAAITLANDTPLGLSSVLFSKDEAEQARAVNELQSGSTYINRYASSDIRMPFGGTKRSGFGREMAKQGLREFTNLKTVIIAN